MADITSGIVGHYQPQESELTIRFQNILKKKMANDPLLMLGARGLPVEDGVIYIHKWGADEDIIDINATVEDDYSNKDKYLSIPVNKAYKTKPILVSKQVYGQYGLSSKTINNTQLAIKADKLLKTKINFMLDALVNGTGSSDHAGDGPIGLTVLPKTSINTFEWKDYQRAILKALFTIIRIGVKNPDGTNNIDYYRTGLDLGGYEIVVAPEVGLLYQEYYDKGNLVTSAIDKNTIGTLYGIPIKVSRYLPFIGLKTDPIDARTKPTVMKGNSQKITVSDDPKHYIPAMVIKKDSYVSYTALDNMYNTEIRQSTKREVGWEIQNGAGTIWADEINALDFTGIAKDLGTIVTVTDLGAFATQPTESDLEARVKSLNPNYELGNATFTSITTTGAVMTGRALYSGTKNLSFSISS